MVRKQTAERAAEIFVSAGFFSLGCGWAWDHVLLWRGPTLLDMWEEACATVLRWALVFSGLSGATSSPCG
jgi:hypothetical protein